MAITKVGVIGEGELSQALTRILAGANIETVISNGRPEVDTTATLKEAADEEVVLLSVPWKQVSEVLSMIPDWEGRILVDATDPVLPDFKPADLGGRTSSEIVSELAPGAQLVKAFNTLPPNMLATDPKLAGGRRVLFYSGDHVRAKGEVARLIARLGFAGVDLGSLAEGGRLQQYPHGVLRGLDLIRLDLDVAGTQPAVV